jgi:uncharacterized protein
MDRRKFIGNSGKQLVALNLLGLTSASALANESKQDKTFDKTKILYRTLGKTGISVPIVSMGVMNANNPNLIKAAWDAGIRHFDTAYGYQNGNNEKMVGSVLKELKVRREDVTIATKIGIDFRSMTNGKERKEDFLKRFDESLHRLQMDHVEILYLHAVDELDQVNDPYIMEAFTELKAKKKIRFAGFSTHNYWPELLMDAVKKKFYDVILISYNYAMFDDKVVADAIKAAAEAGIGLIAMKTQCKQGWYRRELPAEQQKYYEDNEMNAALLKWVLRNENIATAIPGFTTYKQLEEDMPAAYNLDFTKEEEEFFKSKDVKLAFQSVCRLCGNCVASCPGKVDIPSLMRTHMYSLSYGNPLMAKQTLSAIKPGFGLDACSKCDQCTGKCQRKVPIAERIHDLKEIYC